MAEAIMGAAGILLAVIGLVGVTVGVRGIRRHGPDHPMQYPIGLPWLRSRLTTTKTVFQIGQLYAAAGILMGLGAGSIQAQRRSPALLADCRPISKQIQLALTGSAVYPIHLMDTKHRDGSTTCSVGAGRGTTAVTVRTQPRRDTIGESFNSMVHGLERNGLATRPFLSEGQRGVVGTAGQGSVNPHQIVMEEGTAIHSITVHPSNNANQHLQRILTSFGEP